jgi:DNA (cytosine-5)-methyltransferase 1
METVDLFSGCGGLSLGFQNAGFEILAAFDKWKPAVKVLEAQEKSVYVF